MIEAAPLITDSRHPFYTLYDYLKFRLTYQGGRLFVEQYLKKFDSREDKCDFEKRKCLSHNPAFAAEAVDAVKNAICQRMPEIIRAGGTASYTQAIAGVGGGVDLEGSSMNLFMGHKVLPELLSMSRVGIYVDAPAFNPFSTLAEFATSPQPYIYYYKLEDILNWNTIFHENELIFTSVLLRDHNSEIDPDTGLPSQQIERFRLVQLLPGGAGVRVRFYRRYTDPQTKQETEAVEREFTLPKLTRLPFILLDIGKSLLTDIADYQIGLLNLASSDLMYAITSNFPFYVEGYDPKAENTWAKTGPVTSFDANGNPIEKEMADSTDTAEIEVGTMHGRKYPLDAKPPQFIHPSAEPLKASMDKQEQMKNDIRRLLSLAVSNISASRASAESKQMDQQGLESGLSAIGIELEGAEREVARLWAMYEGTEVKQLNVAYPTTYSLKTDAQRIAEASELNTLQGAAPSKLYQKEIAKLVARKLLDGRIGQDTLNSIMTEIDKAKYATSDWQAIAQDVEIGLVDAETASIARGYDGATVVPKAQKERVQRLKDTAIAQTQGSGKVASQARGNPDGVPDATDEKTVSQNPDKNLPGQRSKRGKAK